MFRVQCLPYLLNFVEETLRLVEHILCGEDQGARHPQHVVDVQDLQ